MIGYFIVLSSILNDMKKNVLEFNELKYPQFVVGCLAVLLVLLSSSVKSQNLTVEMCQEKARINYPLIKQYDLIEKAAKYSIGNTVKAYLPQFTLLARATYQSDVTTLPIVIPNVTIPKLAKDQYQATLEMNQILWDGGMVKSQTKSIKASVESEMNKLNVDIYTLNERLNQLFFSIMLINEQIVQNKTLQDELQVNYDRISAYKANGVANQTDLDLIKVEQINAQQREAELKSSLKSYREVLGGIIGVEITEQTVLEKPIVPELNFNAEVKRPELDYFNAQSKYFDSQRSIVIAGNLPRFSLFVQGGYGRPGLNMLTNEFAPFYQGGVRLAWNISGFYTQKSNLDKIEVNKKQVEVQKETFLFNNKLNNKQYQNDLERLKLSIKNDEEIIRLRNNIKKTSEVKVQNGTATVTDLVRDINAESLAKQAKSLHEIQLYITVYQFKNNSNN